MNDSSIRLHEKIMNVFKARTPLDHYQITLYTRALHRFQNKFLEPAKEICVVLLFQEITNYSKLHLVEPSFLFKIMYLEPYNNLPCLKFFH
jgi:hypothetical protein